MRITRLRLDHFKAHHELEIEPVPGLTIVRGPNEAGKSSLQQALELALFRKADANREDVRRAWSWGSETPPTVELDFEVDERAGTLRKRFGGSQSEAELTLGGQTIRDHGAIGEELAGLIGVPNESFYRATASVSHADLGAVAGVEPAIGDRLQKAVSGADRGTARARQKLEVAIRRYRTEGHKNPGLLKVARAEIEGLEHDLAEGEAALLRLEQDRAAWVEADERRADLEQQLARAQADLAEAVRAEGLAVRRDQAQERYQRLKRASVLMDETERLEATLPRAMSPPQLRDAVSRLDALEFEISELEAEVATAAESTAAEEPGSVPPRPVAWLLAAVVLVVIGWTTAFLLRDAGLIGFVLAAAVGVGVVVSLVQAARQAGRRRQYGLAMKLAEHASAQHQEAFRHQEDELRRRKREREALLGALGVTDAAAANTLLEGVQQASEQQAHIEGELRGLGVDERNPRRLAESRDQSANELELAQHGLAALGELAQDPAAARAAAERRIARTAPAREAARSEADQAQGRVDANPIDAELVADLAERLVAAQERQTELTRRVAVYEGTLAAIEAAEQATLKTAARYLEERMGPAIAAVTDGRYDEVEVDEKTLSFKVRTPESGELVAVEQLSQGTADQLFLAARLGLVRLVTLDRRPPLILDDPFVTFDAGRGERALRLVRQLSHEQEFQVLYLTCSDRFDTLADKLVVLPGPSAERVLAQPRVPKAPAPPPKAPAPPPEAPKPALVFAPDPRPGPDPVAPRRVEAPPVERAVFGPTEEAEAASEPARPAASSRLTALRTARAEQTEAEPEEAADPVASLREVVVHDEEEALD